MVVPTCAFTNSASNWTNKENQFGVCWGTKGNVYCRSHLNYIGCFNCSRGPTCIWRCSDCYTNFQRNIKRVNIVPIPIIDLFLKMDFENLTDKKLMAYCTMYPEYFYCKPVTWKRNSLSIFLRKYSPSCYSFNLPPTNIPTLQPSITHKDTIVGTRMVKSIQREVLYNTPYISELGNIIWKEEIHIAVVIVKNIITKEQHVLHSTIDFEIFTFIYSDLTERNFLLKTEKKNSLYPPEYNQCSTSAIQWRELFVKSPLFVV